MIPWREGLLAYGAVANAPFTKQNEALQSEWQKAVQRALEMGGSSPEDEALKTNKAAGAALLQESLNATRAERIIDFCPSWEAVHYWRSFEHHYLVERVEGGECKEEWWKESSFPLSPNFAALRDARVAWVQKQTDPEEDGEETVSDR